MPLVNAIVQQSTHLGETVFQVPFARISPFVADIAVAFDSISQMCIDGVIVIFREGDGRIIDVNGDEHPVVRRGNTDVRIMWVGRPALSMGPVRP